MLINIQLAPILDFTYYIKFHHIVYIYKVICKEEYFNWLSILEELHTEVGLPSDYTFKTMYRLLSM